MKSVCVFLGSSFGTDPVFAETAAAMGREIGRRGLELVFGGSDRGCMKILAEAAMEAGGRTTGVIPEAAHGRGITHPGLTETVVVPDLLERKRVMIERSEAFIALPGGLGTVDEIFEAVTWAQLGYAMKPSGLLNVNGYFDFLLSFVERAVEHGFVAGEHQSLIHVESEPAALLELLAAWRPAAGGKWLNRTPS